LRNLNVVAEANDGVLKLPLTVRLLVMRQLSRNS